MTPDQFAAVNGFPNLYSGWGFEDDDLYMRVRRAVLTPCRFDMLLSRYTMLNHPRPEVSPTSFDLFLTADERFDTDGLNNVTYDLLAYEELPLYTRILLRV